MIQLPKINRFAPGDPQSVGQIQADAPNVLPNVQQEMQARGKVIGAAGDAFIRYKEGVADTESRNAAVAYQMYQEELPNGKDGIAYKAGNPAPYFEKFDADVLAEKNEILNKYNDADPLTRAAVERKLYEADLKLHDRRTTLQGKKIADWEDETLESSVSIAKEDARHAVANFNLKDPSSTAILDRVLYDIEDLYTKHGEKRGTVRQMSREDESGNVVNYYEYDRRTQLNIAKARSEALGNAISNLQHSGKVKEAAALLDKYGNYLTSDQKEKLTKSNEKEAAEIKGIEEFSKVRQMPYETAFNKLDKIEDPIVRKKALSELNDYRRIKEESKKASERSNYETTAKWLQQQVQDGRITSVTQLENTQLFKRTSERMNSKQIAALYSMIEQPKTSNGSSKIKAEELLQKGEFENMDYTTFSETVLPGLSKNDRNFYDRQWRELNSQTPSNQAKMYKNMTKELTNQLHKNGIISKNDFGKFDDDTQVFILETQDELKEAMKEFPPEMSYEKQMEYVKKFVADKKAEKAFSPPPRAQKFDGGAKPSPTPTSTPPPADANSWTATLRKANQELRAAGQEDPPLEEIQKRAREILKTGK